MLLAKVSLPHPSQNMRCYNHRKSTTKEHIVTITVAELREVIKDLDPSMEVIMCREAESFRERTGTGEESPLAIVDTISYFKCADDIYYYGWTADEADADEDEWMTMKQQSRPVLVLVPAD
jgi:hypothetical protein